MIVSITCGDPGDDVGAPSGDGDGVDSPGVAPTGVGLASPGLDSGLGVAVFSSGLFSVSAITSVGGATEAFFLLVKHKQATTSPATRMKPMINRIHDILPSAFEPDVSGQSPYVVSSGPSVCSGPVGLGLGNVFACGGWDRLAGGVSWPTVVFGPDGTTVFGVGVVDVFDIDPASSKN